MTLRQHRKPVFGEYQDHKAILAWCLVCGEAIVAVGGVWWHLTRTEQKRRRGPR